MAGAIYRQKSVLVPEEEMGVNQRNRRLRGIMGLIKMQVQSYAPVEVVYEIAHQILDFVDSMPHIKNIRKLEENKEHTYSKTEWVLDVPLPKILGEVSWIKDAHWNDTVRKCDISLNRDSRGIVKKIKGLWKFTPCPEGTDMSMNMDLTVKHFLIGSNITMMIDTLFRKNMESLMLAIGAAAEKRVNANGTKLQGLRF